MNSSVLPALGAALVSLAAYAELPEVTDETLAKLAADVERVRRLLAGARGTTPGNACPRHPGGPLDPADGNACLLCRTQRLRAHRPPSADRAAVRHALAAADATARPAPTPPDRSPGSLNR